MPLSLARSAKLTYHIISIVAGTKRLHISLRTANTRLSGIYIPTGNDLTDLSICSSANDFQFNLRGNAIVPIQCETAKHTEENQQRSS